jgi:hypothetical protein
MICNFHILLVNKTSLILNVFGGYEKLLNLLRNFSSVAKETSVFCQKSGVFFIFTFFEWGKVTIPILFSTNTRKHECNPKNRTFEDT